MNPASVGNRRTKDMAKFQMERIEQEQSSAAKIELRKECGLRETDNPLLLLNVDLYQYVQVNLYRV